MTIAGLFGPLENGDNSTHMSEREKIINNIKFRKENNWIWYHPKRQIPQTKRLFLASMNAGSYFNLQEDDPEFDYSVTNKNIFMQKLIFNSRVDIAYQRKIILNHELSMYILPFKNPLHKSKLKAVYIFHVIKPIHPKLRIKMLCVSSVFTSS